MSIVVPFTESAHAAPRPHPASGPSRPSGETRERNGTVAPLPLRLSLRPGDGLLGLATAVTSRLEEQPMGPSFTDWSEVLERVEYAFQPIVNIHTGAVFGLEALLRNQASAGFDTAQCLFDRAFLDGRLETVSLALLDRAVRRFSSSRVVERCRLFYNIDNRVLLGPGFGERVARLARDAPDLPAASLCLEISERHEVSDAASTVRALRQQRRSAYKLALDDFGTGFSGLQLLYQVEPDYIKIDRFFITDIASDPRKRLFVASIVNVAHVLGVSVIAEGVETADELRVCREVGCDLAQGFFVQRPCLDLAALADTCPHVAAIRRADRRTNDNHREIADYLENVPALPVDAEVSAVFEHFRHDPDQAFYPVVNGAGEPLGIVRERDLREYAYSVYGRDLLRNRTAHRELRDLVVKCPIADVNLPAERILELYSLAGAAEGIIMVRDLEYAGFLFSGSLLKLVHEKSLLQARDQNPLTRLPGNTPIYQYVSEAMADRTRQHVLVYFDLNHFKPFNDRYGFRTGDRALQLFADLLQKHLGGGDTFVGHIGGDDFFVGACDPDAAAVIARVRLLQTCFERQVESFYGADDRQRGFLLATDRDGREQSFPLLTAAAAVLVVPCRAKGATTDTVVEAMTDIKRAAKGAADHLATATLCCG